MTLMNVMNCKQAPLIRKALVFYIYSHLTFVCLEGIKIIIATIIEYSAASSANTAADALQWTICHLIDAMSKSYKVLVVLLTESP